jgi:multisubunit Na+/H+ antiporter MnhB subunit
MNATTLMPDRLRAWALPVGVIGSVSMVIFTVVSIWETWIVRQQLSLPMVIVISTGFATTGFLVPWILVRFAAWIMRKTSYSQTRG